MSRAVAPALPAAAGLAAGLLLRLVDTSARDVVLGATAALVAVPLAVDVARSLVRRDVGVDLIALVAIVGALALGEYLAAAVVALMLAGGNALDAFAVGRAKRELRPLVERAPRIAHRRRGDELEEVPVDAVVPDDVVVVRAGEIVPVDGTVGDEVAIVDDGDDRRRSGRVGRERRPGARARRLRRRDAVPADPRRDVAFLSGVSRAARAGVVVKGGGVIERLGSARSVLLDKRRRSQSRPRAASPASSPSSRR